MGFFKPKNRWRASEKIFPPDNPEYKHIYHPEKTIKIANLLFTRKCNLNCFYCRISGNINYENKPMSYPDKSDYFKSEKDTEYWIECVDRLYKHNKDVFLVNYGGELFLRKDMWKIIKHCNDIGINYTIISSCNPGIQSLIHEFFGKLGSKVKGFTASVDPGFYSLDQDNDVIVKSASGFEFLKELIALDLVDDPVAEITVDSSNMDYLIDTVKILSSEGITSSITFIEPAKNEWYDFSSITDDSLIVSKSQKIKGILRTLAESDYKIHMKNEILPMVYDYLPNQMTDCGIEDTLHNITIDSDGRMRLCLRIRGEYLPKIDFTDLLDENGTINKSVHNLYRFDKEKCCEGCIWTCPMMSKFESSGIINH